jgi:hypothetical protein
VGNQYPSREIDLFLANWTAKNSAQATEPIPTRTFDLSYVRNLMSSDELRTSVRIKKPVSRWIIACERVVGTMMRVARRHDAAFDRELRLRISYVLTEHHIERCL